MKKIEFFAILSLSSIFFLRMLGLFLLLPIFGIYLRSVSAEENQSLLSGLVLGGYSLTQACFNIPMGVLSDKIGRRIPIIIGFVLFVLGALIAAYQENLFWIAFGRIIQGTGAVSSVVTAWLSDLTSKEIRTRAMASIGISAGLAFFISLIFSGKLYGLIGLDGLFYCMAILGILAIFISIYIPSTKTKVPLSIKRGIFSLLKDPILIKLNIGVFILHITQMILFLILPSKLIQYNLPLSEHWKIYLIVLLIAIIFTIPIIFYFERHRKSKLPSIIAIICIFTAQLVLPMTNNLCSIALAGVVYFIGFNVMEAIQPSLVSNHVSYEKGAALGIYNTIQSIGLFFGGLLGGVFLQYNFEYFLSIVSITLTLIWLYINLLK